MIRQSALESPHLRELVRALRYRPGWTFELLDDFDRGQGSEGTTLDIVTCGYNSYHPERGETYQVHHYAIVPPAAFNRRAWQRWLFEQILLVERHEACEFFRFETSDRDPSDPKAVGYDRPYRPNHAPGNDPYTVVELSTDEEARTSFRGQVNPS